MGMYTELKFNSALKKSTPAKVVDILKYMINNTIEEPEHPHHPLFTTSRWEFMLTSDSYYFDATTHSTFRFDDISQRYYLNIQCNLKNYGHEIEFFLQWIHPYLDQLEEAYLGHYRYEENREPTLIYF